MGGEGRVGVSVERGKKYRMRGAYVPLGGRIRSVSAALVSSRKNSRMQILCIREFLRELTNIQIRTVTAERKLCSECICPTNVLQLNEGRKEASKQRKEGENQKEREKEERKEN